MGTPHRAPTLIRHIRRLATAKGLPQFSDRELLRRFTVERDEAAFATLVKRHGSMVLQVGMRVLQNRHDAEDIFQATFLVLTRKAASLRWHESVGNWLYQAAYRIARKMKVSASRRVLKESRAAERPVIEDQDNLSWREVEVLLDEELQRLPVKYRVPLVFCYLEGATRDEAAQQLGWSLSTLKRRLERGRELLRVRLIRRGLTFSAALFAPMLTQTTAKAALAPELIQATVRTALQLAAGLPVAGLVSGPVAALVEGGLKSMLVTKLKMATAVLLAGGLVAGAGALARQVLAARDLSVGIPQVEVRNQKVRPSTTNPTTKPQAAENKDTIAYGGRVLGPDGRPVAGAKLYLHMGGIHWQPPGAQPTTGPDGRFQFTVPKAEFERSWTVVTATAPGHGPGWVIVPAGDKRDDLTLQLVNDDVPITGQIVDLEGKPIPDATLRVQRIDAAEGEDLGPWLEAAKGKKELYFQLKKKHLSRETIALSPTVSTDASGRFRLAGIGRDRLVEAQLEGPTIVTQPLHILTRRGESIAVLEDKGNPEYGEPRTFTTYYGANFRHVAAPTKPIVGVVRDKDTKKPLAGITVRGYARVIAPGRQDSRGLDMMRTISDDQGHYRLVGMPKGEGYKIVAIPSDDQPYVVCPKDVPDRPGLEAVTVDFELKRGIRIEGKISDKVTGKPMKAYVEYFSVYPNPHLRDYEGFDSAMVFRMVSSKDDGSYRVAGIPGPGLLVVWRVNDYLLAEERDDEEGVDETHLKKGQAPYHLLPLANYGALARIDPAKGVESVKRDVTLDPGWTFTGTVLGPDGKPLIGAWSVGTIKGSRGERKKTAEFTVRAFNPHRPHDIFFQHLEKGLVGVAQPPKENGGSVTVQMTPGAAVKGRLVDANGKPRPGVELELWFHSKQERSDSPWSGYSPESIKTDSEGRFRIEALLPGYEFRLSDDDRGQLTLAELRSGQTKDLRDVRMKGRKE